MVIAWNKVRLHSWKIQYLKHYLDSSTTLHSSLLKPKTVFFSNNKPKTFCTPTMCNLTRATSLEATYIDQMKDQTTSWQTWSRCSARRYRQRAPSTPRQRLIVWHRPVHAQAAGDARKPLLHEAGALRAQVLPLLVVEGRTPSPWWCPGAPPASSPACWTLTGTWTWIPVWPAWKRCSPESREKQSWTCNVKAKFSDAMERE